MTEGLDIGARCRRRRVFAFAKIPHGAQITVEHMSDSRTFF